MILALVSLVLGMWTGLTRMGWDFRLLKLSLDHGAIMVGGFLGTLISLEKVIPLKKKFLFLIPAMSGTSVLVFYLGQRDLSFILLILSATALSAVFLYYLIKEKNIIYVLMLAGSLFWLTGNLLLITRSFYPLAFPWWLAFVLFVITSERVELMKFLPVSNKNKMLLIAFLCVYITGVLSSFHGIGYIISGGALAAIALWLLRNDLIRISIHKSGLPKFVAVALLCGYSALLLTGVFLIALNNQALAYDATVHTFFLGFAFSMIFAHGPIILPGVLGISVKPYHKILYLWLLLLHGSWLTRIAADIILNFELRKYSGIAAAISIIGYFATMAILTSKSLRRNVKVL